MKDRTAASNRGKTLTLALLKRQSEQHLKQIETQIKTIDQEHAAILAAHISLKARFDILVSMPGLGAVTALALLIGMPEDRPAASRLLWRVAALDRFVSRMPRLLAPLPILLVPTIAKPRNMA